MDDLVQSPDTRRHASCSPPSPVAQPASRPMRWWKRVTRPYTPVLLALVGIALYAAIDALERDLDRFAAGPMLRNITQEAFTVQWWDPAAESGELVVRRLGNEDGAPETTVVAGRRNGRFEARVAGLASGTAYSYAVYDTSRADTSRLTFGHGRVRTARPAGAAFSFIAVGDTGSGDAAQLHIAAAMEGQQADFVLHTGDVVYPRGAWRDYRARFFDPYRQILPNVPFFAVPGNHDYRTAHAAAYLNVLAGPPNGPEGIEPGLCYWFDWGDARFFALDSNLDDEVVRTRLAPWLRDVLGRTRSIWKIAFTHQPPYTWGPHPPDSALQEYIVPILEKAGVVMVFSGHNHVYERTAPLVAGSPARVASGGIVYVTTGAGGQHLYAERRDAPDFVLSVHDDTHSFSVVDVTPASIRIRAISGKGRVLDDATITGPR